MMITEETTRLGAASSSDIKVLYFYFYFLKQQALVQPSSPDVKV
jgi:hypothetical protein